MNETRETANADVYQAISRSVKDIASGRAERDILFHKKFARSATFYENAWYLPPCRRRIGPVVPADAWFGTDCVRPVM
jgi:hypothetical protein